MQPFPARLLCLLLLAGLFAASPATAQTPARTISDTVPLDAGGTVIVDNHEGRIIVETWDRNEVQYEARIMPTDDDPEAERTTIEINARNDRLRLATTHDENDSSTGLFGWQWGGSNIADVHYILTVPRTAQLTIDDHESEIEVTGLQGALRIDTHEGPIAVAEQRGDVLIDNHESTIDLRDVEGDLEIDTHEGRIMLDGHRGDVIIDSHESEVDLRAVTGHIEVDTHEGTITAEDLRGGFRLDAHDADADVDFAALTDEVNIDAREGRFRLYLPADAAFDLRTDLDEDADLDAEFDLDAIRITDGDEVNYRGAVNGGGPRIYLASNDGTFDLRIR